MSGAEPDRGDLLRCESCGGSVMWDAGHSEAACLFCGSVTLALHEPTEPVPVPDAWLPMAVLASVAEERFRGWATGSWFRPRGLRTTAVELRAVLLPAWRFDCALETHWAGLRPALGTRSGKEPASGVAAARMRHMVPASAGLSRGELDALRPFDESVAEPWATRSGGGEDGGEAWIWEPPALSQRGARVRAHLELAELHGRRIADEQGLTRCKVSPLIEDEDARLLMLPIYIGTFRYRDRPWRFVVNGHSGEVVGEAPVDRVKLAAVVGLALALALVLVSLALHR